ncbi:CDP-alcohol phosphatidyltransferase family protein [Methanobacterium sp. CWC-01]|uniref:CDP-alcohol phosphatidyltransferase family protein n=1 Tax=Methanobacterium aridiramus TaxID=2584467 RepID=UPI002578130C|nr:CDP-alcohol phosphatidyltransferase family protein [Methanobacterium sp. CWC-01]WJI09273.1 CDP-alcohol phosphatidyltransferase family protein [Methanobacterium sp. CWC-01]
MSSKSYLPSAVTCLRFIATPLFFYSFSGGQYIISLLIIVFAGVTDILDGYLARRMDSTSTLGAYLDVTADFTLIFVSFLAFVVRGWYDSWVLLLISTLFVVFLASSRLKKPIYDPVGKYLGSFLMGMILLSLLFPQPFLRQILLIILVLLSIISLISRFIFLSGTYKV